MSTVSPQASMELAARVADTGAAMVDAPVSGSVPAARDGSLAIMVGGSDMGFAAAEPVLRQLGSVTHVGGNGHGLLLKLAVNISLAAQMLAFSEGVLLAERGGIDPAVATEVMTQSAIGSPMLRARAPLLLDLPEQAWFDVELMHKDIRLAREVGRQERIRLPSADTADAMLAEAEKAGYGHRDIAGLFEVLVRASG
jgi:3-hydroxyisobutyrate dehydrogenase-like beta-hydroxyacid dehydrogenase